MFYPYAATKDDADPLGKLIGSHQYKKFGADADKDYNNPVGHGLHPVYMLFQPLKDVTIAAVEDIEQGDSSGRAGMTGVYLSIKGGKVVDQSTGECLLQPDYSCTYINGEKVYQLLDTGKFVKVRKWIRRAHFRVVRSRVAFNAVSVHSDDAIVADVLPDCHVTGGYECTCRLAGRHVEVRAHDGLFRADGQYVAARRNAGRARKRGSVVRFLRCPIQRR
ncbi:hypothetical protein ACFFTM_02575 [Pseudoduganella plicata]|uniref:Uncharacterized protein n=1 Tax=Pseudoduganella plicata TaxID=321984 RepID=A0A4P7B9V4_9BURK|nr:hypothetical protein [Pseudoduganella plicata]QBQ35164.1 hypothetical protein E1742_02525 [Pseudoduganella plicata]GGZ05338.1 hypothetical protein GCM10007388_43790 [Pseudoduganella plicata]